MERLDRKRVLLESDHSADLDAVHKLIPAGGVSNKISPSGKTNCWLNNPQAGNMLLPSPAGSSNILK
jgi:hypothetical protein